MSLRKHGLKALGLTFFAALALMAISAPGASANNSGELLILNAGKTTLSELDATLTGEIDLLGVLHVAAINLEIHCTSFTVQEGTYLASDNIGHAKLTYHGCLTYSLSPLTHLANCEIYPTAADRTAGTKKGLIEAAALLLVLKGGAGGKPVIRAKPSGTNFTTIFYKGCPTGNQSPVTGALTLLAHDGPGNHLVEHLFEEATGASKYDTLIYGAASVANILGSVWVRLAGATHLGLAWGLC